VERRCGKRVKNEHPLGEEGPGGLNSILDLVLLPWKREEQVRSGAELAKGSRSSSLEGGVSPKPVNELTELQANKNGRDRVKAKQRSKYAGSPEKYCEYGASITTPHRWYIEGRTRRVLSSLMRAGGGVAGDLERGKYLG